MKEYKVTVSYVIPETDTFQIFAEDEDDASNQALEMVDDENAEVERITFVQDCSEPYEPPYEDPNQLKMNI